MQAIAIKSEHQDRGTFGSVPPNETTTAILWAEGPDAFIARGQRDDFSLRAMNATK